MLQITILGTQCLFKIAITLLDNILEQREMWMGIGPESKKQMKTNETNEK